MNQKAPDKPINNGQITIPREFYIAPDTEVIFVSDFFIEEYIGGAELTLQAIYDAGISLNKKIQRIHSTSLTEEMIDKNKDKLWVLVNYAMASKEVLSHLVTKKCKYVIIECDYKFCKFRSEHHHLFLTGTPCDCHLVKTEGLWTEAFFKRAYKVFFMSETQMNRYKSLFPKMNDLQSLHVQKSSWSKEDIEHLISLSYERDSFNNEKWGILLAPSWIKNQAGTEQYCKQNNLPYEILPKLPYKEFLKAMSKYKGLAFHPSGFDTCPRLVIEAKLIGLELDINDNVQIKNESWFKDSTKEELAELLMQLPSKFWKTL